MAIGFPYPRFRESRTFHFEQDKLYAAVESALEDLGWPYKLLWSKEFQARIPTTNWSWHHDFKVTILRGGVIQAESKSAYQEMFIDLGRNRRNVEKFFARLEQMADQPSREES
jgi:hypothetical protein